MYGDFKPYNNMSMQSDRWGGRLSGGGTCPTIDHHYRYHHRISPSMHRVHADAVLMRVNNSSYTHMQL